MNKKQPLLYLVHRLPYPPNKGDKIRSFHLLKHLSKQYDIYLATFIDDKNDWQYVDIVKEYCRDVCVLSLNPTFAKVRALPALLTGQALTIPYYADSKMRQWVDETIAKHNITQAVAYSSSMAQYLEKHQQVSRYIDFVDVDSDKWRQYAESMKGISRWVYQREHRFLETYERKIVGEFDYSFLVSEKEAALLQKISSDNGAKVGYFNNGVDLEFFDPNREYDNPLPADKVNIVFTGAMDYWANVDAVKWFCEKALPIIKQRYANAHFTIVGSNPTKDVLALASDDVSVTGRVPDVRSYIVHADLAVAPMQIARGIQNKVLEALALNKTVVVTSAAYEGLVETEALDQLCYNEPDAFAQCCLEQLEKKTSGDWREYVTRFYSWDSCLSRVDEQLVPST
ncbi:TIGR03087 family PEP-CTERM/XrtA system glycosyltransferase [Pleionea sp. CnH1-48]|uniref:TIGR03087 family PEP-CTERM/XrtA system glycosyltransferase n=1 Tax=Pleionea sp. CnH1-48 TaxID=2954494 RepID=UPI002097F417|nr:TIGR03087 family PEP-CTERM/XrtA system glycosyltransferase [Pleionea sp. CnH1-48]MCO7226248.1 TIGR03087 family PEP-CTERM/XrtA system glycosyltransferase [Pleionea sp. CnH1-48]